MFSVSLFDMFVVLMSAVGDLFAVLAVGSAGLAMIARLLGVRLSRVAHALASAGLLSIVLLVGLYAKVATDAAGLQNGIAFGFSDLTVALLAIAALTFSFVALIVPALIYSLLK